MDIAQWTKRHTSVNNTHSGLFKKKKELKEGKEKVYTQSIKSNTTHTPHVTGSNRA